MSINDQGPQNVAQAEAEALRALEAGAWRVWQAGSGPLPAAYARWCAAEIELATAALRERAEKAEADRSFILMANYRLVAERDSLKAEVAQLKEGSKAAHGRDLRSEVARVCDLLDAKPYTPRVGDAFTWDGRHFIFSGPAAPAGSYVPRVGDVVLFDGEDAESAEKLPRIVTAVEPDGWWSCVHINRRGGVASGPFRLNSRISHPRLYRPATPAERAAAGLEPVDAGLVGQHGELLKAAVAKEAPAQPQVIPGSLRGFPWDADWDKVIDGDAVIYGGRKITFRVEPFRADPHPAPAPADGSAAKFDEAIAAFDRARAEWREAIKQPQVLPEHLAYIEASASAWIDLRCASEQATKAANALRAAVARRDGAKGGS